MKVRIVVARNRHAPGIARVAAAALEAKVTADRHHVMRVLDAGCTFVAIAEGEVVGFVSNFTTRDSQNRSRFELDLLGVAPAWRGGGIGARLIGTSLQAARETGAATIRALVRRDNIAMQRICAHSGFQRSPQACQLWVSNVRQPAGNGCPAARARIIAVDTLTYSGFWLEGALSQSAIDEARNMLQAQPDRTDIGAVVAEHDRRAIDLLRSNAFERIGDFNWWSLNL